MIIHSTFYSEVEMVSLTIYYVFELPTKFHTVPEKRYYWHDKTCAESIGPFDNSYYAMKDYSEKKKKEKALQKLWGVKKLLNTGGK